MSEKYHPVAFDEVCERFMAEIRINSKRLTQLEKIISPLLARETCVCSDDEAAQLQAMAITAAIEVIERDFGGMKGMAGNFDIWIKHQRETGQL